MAVSIGGIVDTFDTSPNTVGTALIVYSLVVAGLVMLGGKLGKQIGARPVFQAAVVRHGLAMALVALSGGVATLFAAQAIAGVAAALVPTLVVLIAANCRGRQQAKALGFIPHARRHRPRRGGGAG